MSEGRTGSFVGRSECLQDCKERTWEDPAREGGSDESEDTICTGPGKDRQWSGYGEELVDGNEHKACCILVVDVYER